MVEQNNQFNFIASKLKSLDSVNTNLQENMNNVRELKNSLSNKTINKDGNSDKEINQIEYNSLSKTKLDEIKANLKIE